jgi:hypothetical protein
MKFVLEHFCIFIKLENVSACSKYKLKTATKLGILYQLHYFLMLQTLQPKKENWKMKKHIVLQDWLLEENWDINNSVYDISVFMLADCQCCQIVLSADFMLVDCYSLANGKMSVRGAFWCCWLEKG